MRVFKSYIPEDMLNIERSLGERFEYDEDEIRSQHEDALAYTDWTEPIRQPRNLTRRMTKYYS